MSEGQPNSERDFERLEDELSPLLQTVIVPSPSSHETRRLLESLVPVLEEEDLTDEAVWQQRVWRRPPSFWRQLKTQAKLYGWLFWMASFFGFALITLTIQNEVRLPLDGENRFLFQLYPLALFAGLLYSYRTWDRGMRTVERVTVFPPALIVFCRFIVVLGFDIVLTVISCVYLVLTDDSQPSINPFLFALHALAPLALLFGVTVYTMLHKGMKIGMIAGGVVWALGFATPVFNLMLTSAAMLAALIVGAVLSVSAYRRGRAIKQLELG